MSETKITTKDPTLTDWVLLAALGVLWGSGFLFIKKAVQTVTPVQMTFLRMGLSALVSAPVFLWFLRSIDWTKWKSLMAIAFLGYGVPNYLFALAEQHERVSSGVAGVLNSIVPILAMCIGYAFFRATVSRKKMLGISLCFAGVLWLVLMSSSNHSADPRYALLCLVAAAMYATTSNIIGSNLREFHPASIGATAFVISSPFCLVGAWATGAPRRVLAEGNSEALVAVIYLAVVSTVFGSFLFNWIVQRTSAVFATSVAYLFPVVSLGLGAMDGESLGAVQLTGALLILVGLYLSRR